jgi:DNA invertase Pin-like site-specific DNA recombinase
MQIQSAGVSTVGQNLDAQIDKLKTNGCDSIFEVKGSGGGSLGGHTAKRWRAPG